MCACLYVLGCSCIILFYLYTGCPICLNEVLTDPVTTNCCKNQFCRACIDQGIIHSPYCPICKMPLRKVVGNQPLGGAMNHYVYSNPLPGYPKCGTITITYQIPSGTQGPEHPNPGKATDSHNNIRCMYSWLNVCKIYCV